MITIPLLGLLALILLAIGIGLVIGGTLEAFRERRKRRELADQYSDMSEKWRKIAEQMEQDPMRAGLDIGQEFIIRQIRKLLDEHEERLETKA